MRRAAAVLGLVFLIELAATAAADGAARKPEPLLGTLDDERYLHVSRAFRVRATSGEVEDSQGGVDFLHRIGPLGSLCGWDSVHFVKPELGAGQAPRDVLAAIVDGFHKGLYRRKKVKPAVLDMGEQAVSGRKSLYAKVSFPEYPGTGVTVFAEKGRRRDADFVGHLYIVPIDDLDLGSLQRGTRIDYLLVTSMRCTAFYDEAAAGSPDFVAGLEILARDTSTGRLREAIAGEDLEALRALLDGGADLSVRSDAGETILMLAADQGHLGIVEELLTRGAEVNAADAKGATALMLAAFLGHGSIVESLLAKGAEVDGQDSEGVTALMLAGVRGNVEIAGEMIAHGAGVDTRTAFGWTALMLAAPQGEIEVVRTLLAAGADPNARSQPQGGGPTLTGSTTSLMGAVEAGHAGVVDVLLAAGALVDARDEHGNTPLMIAATEGHLDIVKRLVESGAAIQARNVSGKTARDLARRGKHRRVVEYLDSRPRKPAS
jgi:ankyrin repeat protein